jgi:uncharacterized membrane protein
MDDNQAELRRLAEQVRELLARVSRLEQALGMATGSANAPRRDEPQRPLEVVRKTVEGARGRHDLEARIGSQWLNRIGIAAMLIGVSYFLKYAFESNWIGPAGQILIGLFGGVAVVVWSEWFRTRGYEGFSYSLKAVGIGALYLSLWAAFQAYHLVPEAIAFSGMVIVTGLTVALALMERAEVLAAFALAGGFATPVLISTGQNQELQLFSYVALLNLASLVLLFKRGWRRLLLLSFSGTVALYFAWYAHFYSPEQFGLTFAFATVFFAAFTLGTVLGMEPRGRYSRVLLAVAALNGVVFFLAGYLVLETASTRAGFAAGLALVYLAVAQTGPGRPRELQGTQVALAIGFVTVAIGLWLRATWITLGWFVEAGLMMMAGFWRQSAFIRWLALGLIAVATAKVFAYDIWGLQRGYRILSFVLLGVLLLAVSFAYQRDWLKLGAASKAARRG